MHPNTLTAQLILEQDYEDELTATQRLNEEIRRAAEDLASSMEDEETKEMSMATVHELDVTVQMHGQNDDVRPRRLWARSAPPRRWRLFWMLSRGRRMFDFPRSRRSASRGHAESR